MLAEAVATAMSTVSRPVATTGKAKEKKKALGIAKIALHRPSRPRQALHAWISIKAKNVTIDAAIHAPR